MPSELRIKDPKKVATGKRSKSKGKRRELEWAHFLQDSGLTSAKRTSQFCGRMGDSDVVAEELSIFHQEVKGAEQLNLWEALTQAKEDATKTGNIPIVAHRKNRTGWMVTMTAEEWLKLALYYRRGTVSHSTIVVKVPHEDQVRIDSRVD